MTPSNTLMTSMVALSATCMRWVGLGITLRSLHRRSVLQGPVCPPHIPSLFWYPTNVDVSHGEITALILSQVRRHTASRHGTIIANSKGGIA